MERIGLPLTGPLPGVNSMGTLAPSLPRM